MIKLVLCLIDVNSANPFSLSQRYEAGRLVLLIYALHLSMWNIISTVQFFLSYVHYYESLQPWK